MQTLVELTPRQREVLAHFRQMVRSTGAPPTIREVMRHFRFTTPRGAEVHLRALAAKGYLAHFPGQTPAYRPQISTVESTVPVLGRVPAGRPSDQPELLEGTLVLPWSLSERAFAIRVVGDSLRDSHVIEGDLVIVDPNREQRDGDIVLALVGGEHAVKLLRIDREGWHLAPANPAYPPVWPKEERDKVLGPVVGLMRRIRGSP
jgi:repressor LexA